MLSVLRFSVCAEDTEVSMFVSRRRVGFPFLVFDYHAGSTQHLGLRGGRLSASLKDKAFDRGIFSSSVNIWMAQFIFLFSMFCNSTTCNLLDSCCVRCAS